MPEPKEKTIASYLEDFFMDKSQSYKEILKLYYMINIQHLRSTLTNRENLYDTFRCLNLVVIN